MPASGFCVLCVSLCNNQADSVTAIAIDTACVNLSASWSICLSVSMCQPVCKLVCMSSIVSVNVSVFQVVCGCLAFRSTFMLPLMSLPPTMRTNKLRDLQTYLQLCKHGLSHILEYRFTDTSEKMLACRLTCALTDILADMLPVRLSVCLQMSAPACLPINPSATMFANRCVSLHVGNNACMQVFQSESSYVWLQACL